MISFKPTEFALYEDVVKNGQARIDAAKRAQDGAADALLQWSQRSAYLKIIEADVVTGISKVIPIDTYVLRPSEAKQIATNVE